MAKRLTAAQRFTLERLESGATLSWSVVGPSIDDRRPCNPKTARSIARRGWITQPDPEVTPDCFEINTQGRAALAADKYPARGSSAMQSAFRRGFVDGWLEGLTTPTPDCPYADIRRPSGGLSWSRAFQRAWEDGYAAGRAERQKGDPS